VLVAYYVAQDMPQGWNNDRLRGIVTHPWTVKSITKTSSSPVGSVHDQGRVQSVVEGICRRIWTMSLNLSVFFHKCEQ